MENLVGDVNGLIHLVASIIALLTGTMVLGIKKGTQQHKKIGYAYFASMMVLIITAFMIYRLFDGWGPFHYTTIISLVTLGLGMIPIWMKKPKGKWKYLHFSFMYWSVIGLYAAFAAEILTRIPGTSFIYMVGVSIAVIMVFGGVGFGMNKSKWRKVFSEVI